MASRRGHGEGSIYQRAGDGRWVASVDLGYINGRRKRRTIYGHTRKEVAEKLKAILRDQQQGLPVAPVRQTVAQFLARWLVEVKQPAVRPRTYRSYEQIVRLYLNPTIGRHPLAKLTAAQIQQMLNQHVAAGLSAETVRRIRDVLRNALNQAVKWDLVPRNVAMLTTPPRAAPYQIAFLTPAQAQQFLASVKGDRLEALYTVALALGLRQSEALGLRWSDVDFSTGTLRVSVALQRVGGKLQLVEPKTTQSRRTLHLPAVVVAALVAHQGRQTADRLVAGARWEEQGLVFTTTRGTPLDARSVVRSFKHAIARAGLPDMRWHDLRHSCASLLLAQRVPLAVVKETLGHSQIAVTMRYTHLIPELQALAASSMDAVLTPGA